MTRKAASLVIVFLSAFLSLVFIVYTAAAQGEGFSDTFDDTQLTGWEHSTEVAVRDGVLRISPGNFAARLGAWGDFDLVVILRYDQPGLSEIHYHATDSGSYVLALSPDRIALLKTAKPPAEPSELANAPLPEPGTADWLSVRITLVGSQHTVYLNDAQLLAAEDPEPIPAGGLVFVSHGDRTTELDSVTLTGSSVQPAVEAAPLQPTQPALSPTPEPAPTSLQSLVQSLTTIQSSTFDLGTFAVNLVLAVITSLILSRVYTYWGASLSNRRKFAANFMLVTVTTTFIILVVRSSVALSLGLVGALSIIRFRAAIKEPEELAYLFFAISLGIGLGDNQRMVTLLTLAVVIMMLGLARLLRQSQADVNLNLTISSRNPDKVGMQAVMGALEKHCAKLRLIRYDENAEALEMSFVIEFRHTSDLEHARSALLQLSPGLEINFMDNKGIW